VGLLFDGFAAAVLSVQVSGLRSPDAGAAALEGGDHFGWRASQWSRCWPVATTVRAAWQLASDLSVAAAWLPFRRCSVPLSGRMRVLAEGKPLPGSFRAATAMFLDAVPFLKAPLWLLLILLRASGENPRSSDRTVATFQRCSLLEDAVLEPAAVCSLEVARRLVGVLSSAKLAFWSTPLALLRLGSSLVLRRRSHCWLSLR
jgi:hypothetical protein